jgi:hypothetical protein
MMLFCLLSISCSSSKKEIRSEQNNTVITFVLTMAQEKTAIKDTISPTATLNFAATVDDTATGVIYVSGNEPFTMLMLSVSPDVQYNVEADSSLKYSLWQLQGKRVNIIGTKKISPAGIRIKVSSFHTAP